MVPSSYRMAHKDDVAVYLVRHAESSNNVLKEKYVQCCVEVHTRCDVRCRYMPPLCLLASVVGTC